MFWQMQFSFDWNLSASLNAQERCGDHHLDASRSNPADIGIGYNH